MGREIDSNPLVGTIKNVDISHQEMDRIFNALEDLYVETKQNTPELEWMPVVGVGNLLCHELGCASGTIESILYWQPAADTKRGSLVFSKFVFRFPSTILQAYGAHTWLVKLLLSASERVALTTSKQKRPDEGRAGTRTWASSKTR
jgi:hypothetical protein